MSDITWKNDTRKLSELIPWEHNPKRMTKKQADGLKLSIEHFGVALPFLISPNNDIYDGHQRQTLMNAMKEHGGNAEVDVRVSSRLLADDERRELIIRLKQNQAGWDFDMLPNLYDKEELLEWGFEIEELGMFEDGADLAGLGTLSQVFTNEQIIDAAFEYFRRTGFPYRRLPIHVCMQEINKLTQTEAEKLLNTDTAYHVADTYHPHRFHVSAEGMKSPFDAFADDKLLIRAARLELEHGTLPSTYFTSLNMVSGTQSASNFRPGFALLMYRRFAPDGATVLDTSTGYGGRLVGFMASGLAQYIGIDPDKPTHEGNQRMAQDLGFAERVELHNLPAEDVPIDLLRERCQFAFTSPPYFSKEHYSQDDTQSWVRYKTGDDWRSGFLEPMMSLQFAALVPGSFSVVNIAPVNLRSKTYPLDDWTKQAGVNAGFEYIETERFDLTRRFGAGMDDEVSSEPVLIFRKPDNGRA